MHGDDGGRTAKRLAGVLIAFLLAALLLAILLAGARLWWVSLRGPEATPLATPSTGEPQSADAGSPQSANAGSPPAASPSDAADPTRAQSAAGETGSVPARTQPASRAEGSAPSATRSIRLAWDRSPDPSVTGYRILFGTVPGLYSGSLDAGNQTTATLNGLRGGTRYYIVAVAVAASGNQSPPSNELEVMTPPP